MEYSERMLQQRQERLELKARLQEKHSLADHPKADLLFEIAWEYRHSSGIGEVEMVYDELAPLLK